MRVNVCLLRRIVSGFSLILYIFLLFLLKNLHMSKKSTTFAPFFSDLSYTIHMINLCRSYDLLMLFLCYSYVIDMILS